MKRAAERISLGMLLVGLWGAPGLAQTGTKGQASAPKQPEALRQIEDTWRHYSTAVAVTLQCDKDGQHCREVLAPAPEDPMKALTEALVAGQGEHGLPVKLSEEHGKLLDKLMERVAQRRARLFEARQKLKVELMNARKHCMPGRAFDKVKCDKALASGTKIRSELKDAVAEVNGFIRDAMESLGGLMPAAAMAGCLAAGFAAPVCMLAVQFLGEFLPAINEKQEHGGLGIAQVPGALVRSASTGKPVDFPSSPPVNVPPAKINEAISRGSPEGKKARVEWCLIEGGSPGAVGNASFPLECQQALRDIGCENVPTLARASECYAQKHRSSSGKE
jgi:hypothetical protein